MFNLPNLPWFKTHRPGMSILFLMILSIIYGLLGNITSMEVIIFITFSVYLLFLVIYVDRISKKANQTSNDPNWYLYNN
jgi:flagellar biosynthesis component FlhA